MNEEKQFTQGNGHSVSGREMTAKEFLQEKNIWVDQCDCYNEDSNLRRIGLIQLMEEYKSLAKPIAKQFTQGEIKRVLDKWSMNYGSLHAVDEDIIIEASDFDNIVDDIIESLAKPIACTVCGDTGRAGPTLESPDGVECECYPPTTAEVSNDKSKTEVSFHDKKQGEESIAISTKDACEKHKPMNVKLGYVEWTNWADKKTRQGHIQKQCKDCGKYYFKCEMK